MNIKECVYQEHEFEMNYIIFHPEHYEGLPLVIYLHGAGERGKNVSHLYAHAIPKLIKEGNEFPAIILCPQCPAEFVWDNIPDKVKRLIDQIVEEFGVEKDRICITGSSMGGFGTWMMGKTYPTFFAGIAPVAGGGMSWRTPKLSTTPVLAVHGAADSVVPMIYSELMVNGVNQNGGTAELIVLEGYEHNDGIDCAYRNTKLIEWLLAQRRTDFSYVPEICEEMF